MPARDHDLEQLARLRMNRLTFEECAAQLKRSARTLKRWAREPRFQQIWTDLQRHWYESAQATTYEAGLEAVQTMRYLMKHARADHVRYEAAKALGDWAGLGQRQHEEAHDDRAELAELLRLIAQRQNPSLPSGPVIEGEIVTGRSHAMDTSDPADHLSSPVDPDDLD